MAKCANCEQPLCTKHAIPQHSASGAKTGKFFCAQCKAADELYQQTAPAAAAPAKPAEPPKQPAPAAKPAPAQKKPEPPPEHSAPLEFNPEPKKPDDKK